MPPETETETPDPVADYLAEVRTVTDAATKGPWAITEEHGRDIADEAWSDVRITGPAGEQIMIAYLTSVLEPGSPSEDADPDFVIAARSFAPRLRAALDAVLALHQPGPAVVLGALCRDHRVLRNFSITAAEADRLRDCPRCSATVTLSCGCGHHDVESCPHRVAITRELLGKEGSDGD